MPDLRLSGTQAGDAAEILEHEDVGYVRGLVEIQVVPRYESVESRQGSPLVPEDTTQAEEYDTRRRRTSGAPHLRHNRRFRWMMAP
jgi:hypothetical protein